MGGEPFHQLQWAKRLPSPNRSSTPPPLTTRLAAMPFLSAAPLPSTIDLQAELGEVERKVSRDFAPFVRSY
jgi:hypothetical protein